MTILINIFCLIGILASLFFLGAFIMLIKETKPLW
jgi:hypothetical protein